MDTPNIAIKNEFLGESHDRQIEKDLFGNDITIPNATPSNIKDRRESKEKSKRELEEEEREKMQ